MNKFIDENSPELYEVSKEDAILALFTRGQFVSRDGWDSDYFIFLEDGFIVSSKYDIEVEPKYFANFLNGKQFYIRGN